MLQQKYLLKMFEWFERKSIYIKQQKLKKQKKNYEKKTIKKTQKVTIKTKKKIN